MDKKVTVLTPNGRRQNVKVTPNTTLLQILEEACLKHGFNSDEYGLKHFNKDLDLTQMFRFTGLPNNCLLEMAQAERKRVATSVDICVQLEDGSRLQGQFQPSDSLWHVVSVLSSEAAESYPSPVAIYMRQEIIGKELMSQTTLKSLGVTGGRAMIRFVNKNPDELKQQANVYIAPTVKEKPKEENSQQKKSNAGPSGGGFAITKDLVQSLKAPASRNEADTAPDATKEEQVGTMTETPKFDWDSGQGYTIRSAESNAAINAAAIAEAELEPEPEINIIGERKAILYSLDAAQKQIEDLPDSFFDLTVHDLKLVLRDLKKVATGNEDVPMLTQKLREMEENKVMLNKMSQYKNCVIRIQFPDRLVLQGIFKPVEKIIDVVVFVRKFLINSEKPFHLFTIPPKVVMPLDKTLLELDFVPTALVHFAFDDDTANNTDQTCVRSEFLERLTSNEGALFAANKFRVTSRKQSTETRHVDGNEDIEIASGSTGPGPSTGAIPKRPRN